MRAVGLILLLALTGCSREAQAPAAPPKPSRRRGVRRGGRRIPRGSLSPAADAWRRSSVIHKYDETLENYSRRRSRDAVAAARGFRSRVAAIDAATLSTSNQLDREQLLRAIDSRILTLEVIRPWARDPDIYSSGITNTAYLMIKRAYAPPAERLRLLIAREKAMPAALAEARKNLENPPKIYTEIAIEQLDGSQGFFKTAVAQAFPEVNDKALLAEFKTANDGVIAALGDYKKWLQDDLLKRSNGDFAIGADTYRKKLAADEMIEAAARRAAGHRRNGSAAGTRRRSPRPRSKIDPTQHADGGAGEGAGGPSAGREAPGGDPGRARRASAAS